MEEVVHTQDIHKTSKNLWLLGGWVLPVSFLHQGDVERLARYFAQRYGGDNSLLEARKALDPEAGGLGVGETESEDGIFLVHNWQCPSRLSGLKVEEGD